MNGADVVLVGVVVLFALLGGLRGFVGEVSSFLSGAAGLVAGLLGTPWLASVLSRWIHSPGIRRLVTFCLLFFVAYLTVAMIGRAVRRKLVTDDTRLVDHLMGLVVGCGRGLLYLVVVIMLLRLTPSIHTLWWRNSLLVPSLESAGAVMARFLPAAFAHSLGYG